MQRWQTSDSWQSSFARRTASPGCQGAWGADAHSLTHHAVEDTDRPTDRESRAVGASTMSEWEAGVCPDPTWGMTV